MRAAILTQYGGPEVYRTMDVPAPSATPGTVVVHVHAFGLNHAEVYFRRGLWGEVARISGIECAGEVHDPGASSLKKGQRCFALMGGMGRSIDGSYAEFVRVPEANVVPIESGKSLVDLATVPESYATAWIFLRHNLDVKTGQSLLVRGGTSALGQAAIDVARGLGVRVFATTRSSSRAGIIERHGAQPVIDGAELPSGLDAVLDIVGNTTLFDSLRRVRYGGRVAMAGFLGGGKTLEFDPLRDLPSGVQLSFTASAFTFGGPDIPLSSIPFQELADKYASAPAHVFELDRIADAHRLMESGTAEGKIVVRVTRQ
jgi:NADPH:quinone reductase-like Zn-dependent oxidoreductase